MIDSVTRIGAAVLLLLVAVRFFFYLVRPELEPDAAAPPAAVDDHARELREQKKQAGLKAAQELLDG